MQGSITQASELAVSVLLSLALRGRNAAVTPRQIAEDIGASPAYTAKVCRQLVRCHILRSQRGAAGGVRLERSPENVTLLEIVAACQGSLLASACNDVTDMHAACGYHLAVHALHGAITATLSKWTLRDLLVQPHPLLPPGTEGHCLISRTWAAALKGEPQSNSG